MFKTILCAIDGSDTAEKALATACNLASTYDADLHLIHAADYRAFLSGLGPEGGMISITQEEFEEPRHKTLQSAESQAKMLGCDSLTAHFVCDLPSRAITDTAENIGAELIVLGSKGHSDISSLLIGSTSHKVCNSANCSCMVVR